MISRCEIVNAIDNRQQDGIFKVSPEVNPRNPQSESSRLREAEALRRGGKLNAARRLLEEQGQGAGLASKILLARLRAQSGELEGARLLYAEVLAADSHNLPALRALASERLASGRWDAAAELLERWAEIDAEDPELEDLRDELTLARAEGEVATPAELPGGESLEEILTRPDPLRPARAEQLEGELLPAPSLRDPAAWDIGDEWAGAPENGEKES